MPTINTQAQYEDFDSMVEAVNTLLKSRLTANSTIAEVQALYTEVKANKAYGVKNTGIVYGQKQLGQFISYFGKVKPAPAPIAMVTEQEAKVTYQPTPAGTIVTTATTPAPAKKGKGTKQALQAVTTPAPVAIEQTPAPLDMNKPVTMADLVALFASMNKG